MGGGGGALTSTEMKRQYDTVIFQDRDLNGTPDLLEDAVLSAPRPFTGVPFAITGTIEAEPFDLGPPRCFCHAIFCHEFGRTL